MSTPSKEVLSALLHTSSICTASLQSLRAPSTGQPASIHVPAFSVLRNDFLSLLAFINSHALSLSLAFKPPETVPAVLKTLIQLDSDVARVTNCALSIDDDAHGLEMRKQMHWATEEVVEGVKRMALGFAKQPSDAMLLVLAAGDEKKRDLVPTASLLSIIERIRASLPEDNRGAIVKRWETDGGALEDGVREAREMIESSDEGPKGDGAEDDQQNGWDELDEDFGDDKLNGDDLERAKKVFPLLRLVTLLHRRLLTHHLNFRHSPPLDDAHISELSSLSSDLVSASDELVSSLYAPQDPDVLRGRVSKISLCTRGLRSAWEAWDVARDLEALDLHEDEKQKGKLKETANGKWFNMCFVQIDKVVNDIEQALGAS